MPDRFVIAPLGGQQTDVKPFMIPDNAFASLRNAYVFRGRVRKRFGSYLLNAAPAIGLQQLHSRLRINIGDTPDPGPGPVNLPGVASQLAIGQQFSTGDTIFTVYQLGAGVATLTTDPAITAVIDSTSNPNTITITGAPAGQDIYYYPSTPVMGITNFNTANINDEAVFAFDMQFAYQFINGGWERLGTKIWTGNNAQFFWASNFLGENTFTNVLYVSNYNEADRIQYWNTATWQTLNTQYNAAGDEILTARIVLPFKDRLLLLNTIEEVSSVPQNYLSRVRFSMIGDPTDTEAWRDDIPGRGDFLDASTTEAIVSAEFLKDRLIVFFERSTWELAYTGNEVLPFRWQQINTELGAESSFATVPFDQVVLGIGNVGIHACTGTNVTRIDQKIPQTVFAIHNENSGPERVWGIRDYSTEMIYWTFPDQDNNATFPTRVLVYNYVTGTWAFNDDTITAFGYFQNTNDITWDTTDATWEEAIFPWNSPSLQGKYRQVLAGNQQGFTFICDPNTARNAPALQITDITVPGVYQIPITCINHNLVTGDYVILENIVGPDELNGNIFQVSVPLTGDDNNPNVFTIDYPAGISTAYAGGGTVARISDIDIYTKQYNFYPNQARNCYVSQVNFNVDKTTEGEISVDFFVSTSDLSLVSNGQTTGTLIGTSVLETSPYALYPFEQTQTQVWHPVYLQADGEYVQLRLYFNEEQIVNKDIVWSDFELNAMVFIAQMTSNRLQ